MPKCFITWPPCNHACGPANIRGAPWTISNTPRPMRKNSSPPSRYLLRKVSSMGAKLGAHRTIASSKSQRFDDEPKRCERSKNEDDLLEPFLRNPADQRPAEGNPEHDSRHQQQI